MNLIDILLLIGVAACMGWGAKKGFVRMIMITAGLAAAIVLAVHHNDSFSTQLAGFLNASAMWVTMAAFILSSMLLFALFRIAAKMFYRVASVQQLGKQDQFGGALVGIVFGWVMMGYLVFLALFLPLPYTVEGSLEQSLLSLRMASAVPFLYETTAKLHPSQDSFVVKMEDSLDGAMRSVRKDRPGRKVNRAIEEARVDDYLDRIDRYFNSDY
ncbi:MAG TPA: CvpA family protein [candidate division Zixibacteria bacterium]|jgi:uncharacterized membrane protein required for colicin V production